MSCPDTHLYAWISKPPVHSRPPASASSACGIDNARRQRGQAAECASYHMDTAMAETHHVIFAALPDATKRAVPCRIRSMQTGAQWKPACQR